MHLREWEEGRGAELEPINRTGSPKPVQAADNPLEEQFLPDADGILSTEWSRAISAIQEDEEASSWLKDHPGARVAVTDYRQGASDSDVQNEWEVTWWPGPEGGSSMKNVVMNRSDAVSETLDDEISVRTSYVGGVAQPGINETVSLSSLGRLHRSVYGVPLETFSCDFRGVLGGSACFMAPHDDINKPRAGGTGAGVYHAGLIIDLRDGRLLQETSFAERLVDKPVQR
jgi:hypothetical protein